MSRILVVDDEVKVTHVIASYLIKEGHKVLVAHDGDTALELAFSEEPDLVVLDLNLPRLKGEEVCRLIRTQSGVPIIMLTAKTAEGDAINGLDLGADDYMTKPFSPRELMARIRAVLRRGPGKPDAAQHNVLAFDGGALVIDPSRHRVTRHGEPVDLTAKEFSLLHLMASSPGVVFTRARLTEALNGMAYETTDRTIDSHVKNLRAKLETTSEPRYVKTVFGVGYKFEG